MYPAPAEACATVQVATLFYCALQRHVISNNKNVELNYHLEASQRTCAELHQRTSTNAT